jgi:tetratricopeptide (TPR) repeat protein
MLWLLARGSLLFYGVKLEDWSWSFQVNKEEKEDQLFDSFFQAIEETISTYSSSLEPISLSFELDIDDSSFKVVVAYFPKDNKAYGISFSAEKFEKKESIYKLSKTFDLTFKELLTSLPDNMTEYSSLFAKKYDQLLLSNDEHINTHIDWIFTGLSLIKEGHSQGPINDLGRIFNTFEEIVHSFTHTKQTFVQFINVKGKERIEAFDQAINQLNQTVSRMNALSLEKEALVFTYNLAISLLRLNRLIYAAELFNRVLTSEHINNNIQLKVLTVVNLGVAELKKNNLKKALKVFNSLEIDELRILNDTQLIAFYRYFGTCLLKLEKFQEAEKTLMFGLEITQKTQKVTIDTLVIYSSLALINYETGNYSRSGDLFDMASNLAWLMNIEEVQADFRSNAIKSFWKAGESFLNTGQILLLDQHTDLAYIYLASSLEAFLRSLMQITVERKRAVKQFLALLSKRYCTSLITASSLSTSFIESLNEQMKQVYNSDLKDDYQNQIGKALEEVQQLIPAKLIAAFVISQTGVLFNKQIYSKEYTILETHSDLISGMISAISSLMIETLGKDTVLKSIDAGSMKFMMEPGEKVIIGLLTNRELPEVRKAQKALLKDYESSFKQQLDALFFDLNEIEDETAAMMRKHLGRYLE